MDTQKIIELEHKYLLQSYKRPPFVLERGEGVYLFDIEGNRYLDMVGGIAVNALGYGDLQILAVMRDASTKLLHTSNLYYTGAQAILAQKLVDSSFADRIFFTNSGTEAVEGALKFARKWARLSSGNPAKYEIIAFTRGFHGRTMGALATTANPKYRTLFGPLIGGISFADYNNLESAAALIGANTAAVIVEPVQGEGGITLATREFLEGLSSLCEDYDALLVYDEVQCGMGRTGTLWAHAAVGVTPDLMTIAKPLGGGLPLGAILMTERVASAIQVGDHGSTFGGGPFVTAVASHVFDRISDAAFLDHVKKIGHYMGEQLRALAVESPLVREIRGRGLMWGVELDEALPMSDIVAAGHRHGVLLAAAERNTIRLVPPLILEATHVEALVEKLRAILKEVGARVQVPGESRWATSSSKL